MTPAFTAPDFLEITHRPDTGFLIGRWLRSVDDAELQAGYEALYAAARHLRCGTWLVDARRRTDRRLNRREWIVTEFLPEVHRHLGLPLRVAFLVLPAHWHEAGAGGQVGDFHFGRFPDEGAANAWLAAQR